MAKPSSVGPRVTPAWWTRLRFEVGASLAVVLHSSAATWCGAGRRARSCEKAPASAGPGLRKRQREPAHVPPFGRLGGDDGRAGALGLRQRGGGVHRHAWPRTIAPGARRRTRSTGPAARPERRAMRAARGRRPTPARGRGDGHGGRPRRVGPARHGSGSRSRRTARAGVDRVRDDRPGEERQEGATRRRRPRPSGTASEANHHDDGGGDDEVPPGVPPRARLAEQTGRTGASRPPLPGQLGRRAALRRSPRRSRAPSAKPCRR